MSETDNDSAPAGKSGISKVLAAASGNIFSPQPAEYYTEASVSMLGLRNKRILFNDPAAIAEILNAGLDRFSKPTQGDSAIAGLMSKALIRSGPLQWTRGRGLVESVFDPAFVKECLGVMEAVNGEAIAKASSAQHVDLFAFSDDLVFDVLTKVVFSRSSNDAAMVSLKGQLLALDKSFVEGSAVARFEKVASLPKLPKKLTALNDVLESLISDRLEDIKKFNAPNDILTGLLTKDDPKTGERFDAELTRANLAGFLAHGRNMLSASLGWTLFLLATQQTAQDRAAAEVVAAAKSNNRSRAMVHMGYCRNVLRESARLYPANPVLVRHAKETTSIAGVEIRKDADCFVSLWHYGRHKGHWDQPDDFNPDRWNSDAAQKHPDWSDTAFSTGPRACPAQGFARVFLLLSLSQILQAAKFSIDETTPPALKAGITIRPKSKLMLQVQSR